MDQPRPLFCLFSFFFENNEKYTTIDYGKSLDWVHGIRTRDCRVEVADESTNYGGPHKILFK